MYEIIVKEIWAGEDKYREESKEIYSQRVESLDLKAVIGAVNTMTEVDTTPKRVLTTTFAPHCEHP